METDLLLPLTWATRLFWSPLARGVWQK